MSALTPSELSLFLKCNYNLGDCSLNRLNAHPEKYVYRLDSSLGFSFVMRLYPKTSERNSVFELVELFEVLEKNLFPSERIFPSSFGSNVTSMGDWWVLLTTFIEGEPINYSYDSFYLLGLTIGKLHALNLESINKTKPLATAGMLPTNEIQYALEQLQAVSIIVPKSSEVLHTQLLTALNDVDLCEDLPRVLIHNDCHPGNAIFSRNSEVILIDWEGAGMGAAVVDIGFMLTSCDGKAPWDSLDVPVNSLQPNIERIEAIIDGYCRHRIPTYQEMARLSDMIRFRSIVYGACHFAELVKKGQPEVELEWWWARFSLAEEVAEIAERRVRAYL